ncbi:type VII toxin-antitoxin system HepT family RNase toxin [Thiosulfativibrio zosterae]|uniref:DUF86 domain-containing protein n=1 Tax=Thiosulfativibrio zosterae TaxID=2675053 RepID=A0A6F8PL51_9GAMM|nr:DUF86 domain-containing protein [Thiosulfativibrio zosterae]BBP42829.1 hypothetical protein THMIRHAT_05750 [Thiosulfativibrio zosterae]
MNDVLLNKKVSIERCIQQIQNYYHLESELPFQQDYMKQDAIAINLQRIAELAIDMAAYLIKREKLGLPQDSKDHFRLLEKAQIIPQELSQKCQNMVGFRNILVHEYQELDLDLMQDVIEHHLTDLIDYSDFILKRVP